MLKINRYIALILMLECILPFKAAFAENSSVLKAINKNSLQSIVAKTAKDFNVPGAFVLLRTPQGEFNIAYGTTTTKLGASIAPQINTHFRIASVTKTMTAAVIVQQAQEGKLSLHDTVAKFLPGVPNGNHITIADLLRMRSGLYNYTDSPKISASLDRYPGKVWTSAEILSIAFSHPSLFKADTSYHYSNTNYVLLGLIAEKIDHKSLSHIFEDRLFKPLGMKNTLLPANTSNMLTQPYSHGYQYGSAAYALVDKPYPSNMQEAVRSGKLKPIDYTFLNPSYALAPGGVISTAHDLALWVEALVSGKVFNANFQHDWLDSLRPEDKDRADGQQYGYGIAQIIFASNKIYFHGGECPGYNTFMGYDPANKITLIVWTNLDVSIDGQLTANAIMVKMLEEIYVASSPDGKY